MSRQIVRSNSQYTFLQWRCEALTYRGTGRCPAKAAYKIDGKGGHAMLCSCHYARFCREGMIDACD